VTLNLLQSDVTGSHMTICVWIPGRKTVTYLTIYRMNCLHFQNIPHQQCHYGVLGKQ